nr:ATP synthase F0 subunit 8 [Pleonosporium sp.]
MPQLDFIIIFPQIFWFFIIFSILYIFILHTAIPRILIVLKSRKSLVQQNNLTAANLELQLLKSQKLVVSKIICNLKSLEAAVFLNQTKIKLLLNNSKLDSRVLNLKMISAITNLILFCNKQTLGSILFFPSKLNLK